MMEAIIGLCVFIGIVMFCFKVVRLLRLITQQLSDVIAQLEFSNHRSEAPEQEETNRQ